MLAVFAKVIRGQRVKTRLQTSLSRQEAETFYLASLADTLETALHASPRVLLYLHGGHDTSAVDDLRLRLRELGFDGASELDWRSQRGRDLGERLETAFLEIDQPALIIGADSPTLQTSMLRSGLEILRCDPPTEDAVLGPTTDGGYWSIGLRTVAPGLLDGVAWSTKHALRDTRSRLRAAGLRTALLDTWTDVDTPADLPVVARHIQRYRREGDPLTARYTEPVVRTLGLLA